MGRTVYLAEGQYKQIEEYMKENKTFVSVSEFLRAAIREYFEKRKGE